jgi:hypothetical protein
MNWFKRLFTTKQDYYWKGRGDGWFALENMVIERIKLYYPDKAQELIDTLLA